MADSKRSEIWNVPNIITSSRIVLSIVVFCLLPFGLFKTSLVLFLIAALTDKIDGWYARKYNLVTKLGRILDPFADKLIICGTFIYLVSLAPLTAVPWGLRAWMVVVIVLREMLVTSLRSMIESQGGDFSANWPGKIKMVFQCAAAAFCLLYLAFESAPVWVTFSMVATLWVAVLSTIYSGLIYVFAAARMMKSNA